jgi:hypothetical protein
MNNLEATARNNLPMPPALFAVIDDIEASQKHLTETLGSLADRLLPLRRIEPPPPAAAGTATTTRQMDLVRNEAPVVERLRAVVVLNHQLQKQLNFMMMEELAL